MKMTLEEIKAKIAKLAVFTIEVEQEDIGVRGNVLSSGDDVQDKEAEDEILYRLDHGDIWAWAYVKVIAKCQGFEGEDALGCCSYKDADDFKRDGYYTDMKGVALDNLAINIYNIQDRIEFLKSI